MSLNFEGVGVPICIIADENKKNRGGNPILFVSDRENSARSSFEEMDLLDKEGQTFQLIPNPDAERSVLYVTGQSGSGKSFFTKKYCREFNRVFPKRNIYLFSSVDSDDSVDDIKNLYRVKIREADFLEDEFEIADFKDSLVIFDDTDVISNKRIKAKVNDILGMILETGRHQNVYCIYTSHLACAGNETRRILNESHSITIFPRTCGDRMLNYLCKEYLGLSKKEIQELKRLPSRSVTILKTYPRVMVGDKNITILHRT